MNTINNFIFGSTMTLKRDIVIKIIAAFGIYNILSLLPDLYHIYGEQGLIKTVVNDPYTFWYQPELKWFTGIFETVGLSADVSLVFFMAIYLLGLGCLFFNYKRPLFGVVCWFIHFMFVNSTYLFSYGADYFTSFMLFVNMLICATYLFNKASQESLFTYAIRFLQIHLCIVYFFAGLGKALGTDWFDGNAIWMVINTFSSNSVIESTVGMVSYPLFFKVLAWGTVCVELLYPILIYMKVTRKVTLISVIAMHAGIAIFMEFYTFGIIMTLLNVIAFGHYFNVKPLIRREEKQELVLETGIA